MFKKCLSILVIATVFLMGSTQVFAATTGIAGTTKEGWIFEGNGTAYAISEFADYSASSITIPEEINGVKGGVYELPLFEKFTNLKEIHFASKFNNDTEAVPWITRVDFDELSKEAKEYLSKNVTVYGYAYDEVEDGADNAMLSPKGFASRYNMKFVDLADDKQKATGVIESIPDELYVDIKESEFFTVEGDNVIYSGEEVITKQIKKILEDKAFDLSDVDLNVSIGGDFDDIHNINVYVYVNRVANMAEKTVKVTYNNTKNYDSKTAKTIEDYLSKVELEDKTSTFNINDAQKRYNLSIEGRANKMANDLGVDIIINGHKGIGEINEYYNSSTLYFIKDDVLYAAKNFYIYIYGNEDKTSYVNELIDNVKVDTSKDTGVVIEGEKLSGDSKDYLNIVETAKKKGYDTILNAYEFKLIKGEIKNGVNIIFDLGKENNNKQAIVLHLKKDGTYQEVEQEITNGTIQINVNELSPFVVAIKEAKNEPERVLDDVPKTGDNNILTIINTLLIITVSILGIIIKSKNIKRI